MNLTSLLKKIFLLTLVCILFFSCNLTKEVDTSGDRMKILQLHNKQRDYHFNKDSIAFANQQSKQFISVNRGLISRPKNEETVSRYNNYFSSVEFIKWDDLAEPIIRFSDDGSMAYTIVDKIVVVNYEDENGKTIEGKTHFAWTAIYRKYEDQWKIDCVTSTEKLVD